MSIIKHHNKDIMSKNIFQIWDEIGRKTSFAVRCDNWSKKFYTIVENVEIKKFPYGNAYGLSTVNGVYSNHYEYDSKWRKDKIEKSKSKVFY